MTDPVDALATLITTLDTARLRYIDGQWGQADLMRTINEVVERGRQILDSLD